MRVDPWTAPSGKHRLLTRLDAPESARYARAVRLAIPRTQPVRSFGCSVPGRPMSTLRAERAKWHRALRAAITTANVIVVADVADCFPSITESAIRAAAARAGGDAGPLCAFLAEVTAPAVPGLPVGPRASALLADAVLAIADERAGAAGLRPLRWVDDVVFAGPRDAVARGERAWRAALADLILREHPGKRRTLRAGADAAGTLVPSTAAGHVIMRTS